MELDKQGILNLIGQQGDQNLVQQAEQQLPDQLDHEQHADLLQRFGIDPQQALNQFGGGGGVAESTGGDPTSRVSEQGSPSGGVESGL